MAFFISLFPERISLFRVPLVPHRVELLYASRFFRCEIGGLADVASEIIKLPFLIIANDFPVAASQGVLLAHAPVQVSMREVDCLAGEQREKADSIELGFVWGRAT
jgi:hypothetical protein